MSWVVLALYIFQLLLFFVQFLKDVAQGVKFARRTDLLFFARLELTFCQNDHYMRGLKKLGSLWRQAFCQVDLLLFPNWGTNNRVYLQLYHRLSIWLDNLCVRFDHRLSKNEYISMGLMDTVKPFSTFMPSYMSVNDICLTLSLNNSGYNSSKLT